MEYYAQHIDSCVDIAKYCLTFRKGLVAKEIYKLDKKNKCKTGHIDNVHYQWGLFCISFFVQYNFNNLATGS